MKIKNLSFIIVVIYVIVNSLYSNNKIVMIYDPLHHHGTNFYNTLKSIFPDSIRFILDIDSTIYDSDALFIFLSNDTNEYILNESEGDSLITYLNDGKHVYIYSYIISQDISNVSFWNYIGIQIWAGFPIITHVDSVVGVPGTFTEDIVLPHEFDSGYVLGIGPGCYPILNGVSPGAVFTTAYAFDLVSSHVVIDLFTEIFYPSFLERVLLHFDLIESSSIRHELSTQVDEFSLYQNYPNPFNYSTTISFRLYKTETIRLQLYNSLGEELKLLLNNQKLSQGVYYYNFDFSSLSSGLYYYVLKAGSKSQVKKLLLSK
jgi:hypothetical protein